MPASIYGYLGSLRREGSVGSLYPVRSGHCTIGRDGDCSVRIHQSEIAHKHCLIESHGDRESTIRSLDPDSVTLLNDARVGETAATLRHGDVVTLGDKRFVWQYPETSKYWHNPGKRYLKISPTTSKATGERVPNAKTDRAKVPAKSSSARRPSTPGFPLKKAASQNRLSSSGSGFDEDSPPVTPTRRKNKKTRATSAGLLAKKTVERKSSGFKTRAPSMLASLQKKASEIGLADLDALKHPRTVYGQLAVLRPNGAFGSRLPLSAENCTVGRGPDCAIRIALSTVADKQCLIASGKNRVSTVANLSKGTSTLLNGKSVGEEPKNLCHGDVITMAERSFRWEYPMSSKFWVPDTKTNTNNPAGVGSKGQKGLVATDDRKMVPQSKPGLLKMPTVGASVPKPAPPKKTSKTSLTTKKPAAPSNSLLRHLNPAQPLHISMKHASSLRTPPNDTKGPNRRKSPPSPVSKVLPQQSRSKMPTAKALPRKASSFNVRGAPNNARSFPKFSDKKIAKPVAAKPAVARKSTTSLRKATPQRAASTSDSSCDGSVSPPPPTEGPKPRRQVAKIDPSLFRGCCFTSSPQNVLKERMATERPASPD